MIIDYTIHGAIQLDGEDPQEAIKNLKIIELDLLGEENKIEFSVDGKKIGEWDLTAPERLPF